MTGTGKSSKKFYINIGPEDSAFGTEASSSSYYSPSGNLSNMPEFKPSYNPIKVPSHATYGEARTVKQGASSHTIKLPYADLVDFRFMAHLFGGRLDQPHILETSGGNATNFSDDELITGGTSGAKARVQTGGTKSSGVVDILLHKFSVGDTIKGVSSGATGTIVFIKNNSMKIKVLTGTFATGGEDIQTNTSPSTNAYTVASAITSKSEGYQTATIILFSTSEIVTGATSTATGTIGSNGIIYQHDLFVTADVDSKSIVYAHENLTSNQHLLLGCVADAVELKGVAGNAPVTGSIAYKCSNYAPDSTIDTEQTIDNSLGIMEYTDITINIDSTDYSGVANAFTITLNRGHADVPAFSSVDPKGYGSSDFASKLNFKIYKEDFAFTTLMQNGTEFTVTITVRRGTANEDEGIFTFNCVLTSESIGDGQNVILSDISPEVLGVPTAIIRDKIANYN